MGKRIQDCTGIRVHPGLTKDADGNHKINWSVFYKNEGKWCNSEEDLMKTIKQVNQVQLFGESYKTWEVGKDGWRNCSEKKEEK